MKIGKLYVISKLIWDSILIGNPPFILNFIHRIITTSTDYKSSDIENNKKYLSRKDWIRDGFPIEIS